MKLTDYILIFIVSFSLMVTGLFYKTELNAQGSVMVRKYTSYAKTACMDAIKSAEAYSDDGIFTSESTRKRVIDTYMQSITYSMNAKNTTKADEIPLMVPMICMIDNNGYYICYTATYADENGYAKISNIMTPINTWGEIIKDNSGNEKYRIRYYLNNYVEVIKSDTAESKSGDPAGVAEYFQNPTELSFLTNENELEERKKTIITEKVTKDMEYYLNGHNNDLKEYGLQYSLELPTVKDADFAKAIESPTIIGFLQGKPVQNGDKIINIYAMAGAEITKTHEWILTDDKFYHRDSHCSKVSDNKKEGILYSDIECAKRGYYPCPNCME